VYDAKRLYSTDSACHSLMAITPHIHIKTQREGNLFSEILRIIFTFLKAVNSIGGLLPLLALALCKKTLTLQRYTHLKDA